MNWVTILLLCFHQSQSYLKDDTSEISIRDKLLFRYLRDIYPVTGSHKIIWFINIKDLKETSDQLLNFNDQLQKVTFNNSLWEKKLTNGRNNISIDAIEKDIKQHLNKNILFLNIEIESLQKDIKLLFSLTKRNKKNRKIRSLLPGIGHLLNNIAGTATDDQINNLLSKIKELEIGEETNFQIMEKSVSIISDIQNQMVIQKKSYL